MVLGIWAAYASKVSAMFHVPVSHHSAVFSTLSTVSGQLETVVHLCGHAPRSVSSVSSVLVQLSSPTKQHSRLQTPSYP